MAVRAGKAQLRALISTVLEGRYEIRSLLGEGGMGTVFAGLQTSLNRPVAIKVLRPEMASSEEFVERFTREARLTARLSHPSLPRKAACHAAGLRSTATSPTSASMRALGRWRRPALSISTPLSILWSPTRLPARPRAAAARAPPGPGSGSAWPR